ncbi:MAG: sugar kinase [Nitrospira sp.]|nr:sugar kinase [Nitrospira sp.]MCA9464157.1 sugar kinase [Nitrospira sp.]MCA9475435.1 sugar kinase [Nitrospira sp.]MCB9711687.1 sugar kinase [Nitrospiraceae bacterium]MDR4487624.1 PfkB family carbohydrate kinase [Nitrospirales bacterium]
MGNLLVVGSVAFDSVKTPFGEVSNVLGGSATYFSTSASFFTQVDLIAVVGDDFPNEHLQFLSSRGINLEGLERRPGKTFRWRGEYSYQLNEAQTLETHLNVLETFRPKIPTPFTTPTALFLGNIDPELQLDVLNKVTRPSVVALDTMNFWIDSKRDALWKVLEKIDILIINDGEARALGQDPNLVQVAKTILSRGPKTVIIKRGEYGVLMFHHKGVFGAPAYPLEAVKDPTGAGDTFAGGFMGYLTASGNYSESGLRQAIIFGSVMASFNVEAFSLDRMKRLTREEIDERFRAFKHLTHFDNLS